MCAICGDAIEPGSGELCARCRRSPLHIDSIRSAVYFEGTVRRAVHLLKYRGREEVAEPLGTLLAEYWRTHPQPVDVIVPVPLHADRLRERGYNQAALLAYALGRLVGLPVDESLLVRQRATAPQVKLDARQRRENVRAAFRCPADVSDMHLLLIDDVATTGATLEACAAALHEHGAASVRALTLARARHRGQDQAAATY